MKNRLMKRAVPKLIKRIPLKPSLILVMGVAGSGKTTIAKEILQRLWAVYLDNNHIADAFFPNTRIGRSYEHMRWRFYAALYTIAQENLTLGNSVLVDAPHIKEVQRREWRKSIKNIITNTKAKMIMIRCHCSETVLHARIVSRAEPRDDWKLRHWKQFLTEQPIKRHIPFPHLDIDTDGSLSKNIDVAVRYIRDHSA